MIQTCDLTTLQIWAGYLSWIGFFKILGATVLTAGIVTVTWGILSKVIYRTRVLLEVAGYAGSAALIAGGYWVSPEHLVWTVMIGCILFAATVYATIWIHEIKGDDPQGLMTLFMVLWGGIAIYYKMTEVGFLAIAALMSLLGFSVVVRSLEYSFGFQNRRVIPSATMAATMIVGLFLVFRLAVPNAPSFVQVFMPGAFWIGTFVALTGLLIMTSRYYQRDTALLVLAQIAFLVISVIAVALGVTFGINAMAGIAGTFLVLYLAEKPLEVTPHNAVAVGTMLIVTGGIMFGAWSVAMAHQEIVERYLTTAI
jgi:hypothetical protein